MATEIIMPKLGMSMEEGKIARWMKSEGDAVETGEPLFEVETDKVNMEVEALVSGVLLKILRNPGDVVPVTEIIGYMGDAGEKWIPGENDSTERIHPEKGNAPEADHPAPAASEPVTAADPKDRIQETRVPATPCRQKDRRRKRHRSETCPGNGPQGGN